MLNGLSIRIGQDKDVATLAEFNVALAWETERKQLSLPVVTKGVETLLKNPQYGFYVVAERANQVIGSLMITYEFSDWRFGLFWWIQSLYVKPAFRRQGVFKKLYEFIKEKALHDSNVCGFRVYVKTSNHSAQSAYIKVGMKETYYQVYEASSG